MKKFNITIVRHSFAEVEVYAETENEAKDIALDNAEGGAISFKKDENELFEVESVEEEDNPYIDQRGNPYDPEVSFPAGGGLHKDCEFNADALYAYHAIKDRYKIAAYLRSKGFRRVLNWFELETWQKGNTEITFESYDNDARLWGYVHTELV